jgi:hypothetical protein
MKTGSQRTGLVPGLAFESDDPAFGKLLAFPGKALYDDADLVLPDNDQAHQDDDKQEERERASEEQQQKRGHPR